MRLARWIFLIAGIWGMLVLLPLLFAERLVGVLQPELYYGFVCLNICWQVAYLLIATEPGRYRPMMLAAILAKGSAFVALTWLYLLERVAVHWVAIGTVDGLLAALFLAAFVATRRLPVPRPLDDRSL